MVLNKIEKPSIKAKRRLMKREPQMHEGDRRTLFIKGGRTNELVTTILKEFASLKKPLATSFQRKNMTRPFDDPTSIEFFTKKSECCLFMFGSHSKKRPNNIILGRTYDHQILDMFEFGVEKYQSLKDFKIAKVSTGTKPCLIFSGDDFEKAVEYQRLKNMLVDVFQGAKVEQLRLAGIEHVYNFTLNNDVLCIKSYKVLLKDSGSKTPRVELEEMGPSIDMKIRRHKIASEEMFKVARKQAKAAKIKKKKNVVKDPFGSQLGRIHMKPQQFENLTRTKTKVVKRKQPVDSEDGEKDIKKFKKDGNIDTMQE